MPSRLPRIQEDFAAEPRSIDLRDYWQIVRRRRLVVLITTLVAAGLAVAYALLAPPSYAATATVEVMPQIPVNEQGQSTDPVNIQSEQTVAAQSVQVLDRAAALLNIQPTVLQGELSHLAVTVPALSDVLQITWNASSPRAAREGADAFANAYLQIRKSSLTSQSQTLLATYNATVKTQTKLARSLSAQVSAAPTGSPKHQSLEAEFTNANAQVASADASIALIGTYNNTGGIVIGAALPLKPSGLSHAAVLALGVLLGLLIGLVLAFVRDVFDDRVRDTGHLARSLGAGTLAVLPRAEGMPEDDQSTDRRRRTGIATITRPDGKAAEAVRALRATLVAVGAREDVRTILVAGADGSVSSSRVAAELGIAIAESGRRVLLVAADMRGSSLPQIFDLPNIAGLSNLLTGGGDPEVVTRQPRSAGGDSLPDAVARRLALLPNGPQVAPPLSVLDSADMVRLLHSQRESYDFVLLDCPPATAAADSVALAAHVDGVIVIAREARTRGRVLEELRSRLDQVGAHVIGGVFIGKAPPGRHRTGHGDPVPVGSVTIASVQQRGPGQPGRSLGSVRPVLDGDGPAAAPRRSADAASRRAADAGRRPL